MNPKPVALLFGTVWPESEASAAGVRQLQWVRFFKRAGFRVILSSPSKQNEHIKLDVECLPLPLNRTSIRQTLTELSPVIVMFDRFILEEQFGHMIYEFCPEALVLLETEDLHLLRRARESLREKYLEMESVPETLYHSDTALREIASILRVDYSYVVSSFEEDFLANVFGVGMDKVQWVPFFYSDVIHEPAFGNSFHNRSDFCFIGNFRHAPNMDGLRWFLREIWPRVREGLPEATLHLFGSYPTEEVMNWNNPKAHIVSHGHAKNLDEVFLKSRVNLAPLRFGAGIKGKILEGLRYGVPCVTTKVGVEGLLPQAGASYEFPGLEANTSEAFARACIELYQDEAVWSQKRLDALRLLQDIYAEDEILPKLNEQVFHLLESKKKGQLPGFNSRILRHELMNSHKYFAKWIEQKELYALKSSGL